MYARPSVRMEQLGSHWTINMKFDMCIFRKTVEKIQVSFTYDKTNVYFTWRPPDIFDMSLYSS